jgi:DNA-directed RNA polymerase subunit RPC12/RpoP
MKYKIKIEDKIKIKMPDIREPEDPDLVETLDKEKRLFSCTHCSYKTHYKGTAKRHVKNLHFAPGNIPCPYCAKLFKHHMSLTEHLHKKLCPNAPAEPPIYINVKDELQSLGYLQTQQQQENRDE